MGELTANNFNLAGSQSYTCHLIPEERKKSERARVEPGCLCSTGDYPDHLINAPGQVSDSFHIEFSVEEKTEMFTN